MDYLFLFLSGLFLCNCIPHLTAGLMGESFPSPFAKPRGIGLSSPVVNFLWGTLNLAVGVYFAGRGLRFGFGLQVLAAPAGFVLIGLYLSHHFGKARAAGFRKP